MHSIPDVANSDVSDNNRTYIFTCSQSLILKFIDVHFDLGTIG